MSKRKIFHFLLVATAFLVAAGIPINSGGQNGNSGPPLIAGRNVNMVSGTTILDGDPYLQRQNEPSIAVSTIDPRNLLAGSNDYRTVDMAESEGELPGLPEGAVAGDAWLGVYKSFDGGQSWVNELIPGYPNDPRSEAVDSPLLGFDAASDPTVRAFFDGAFLYSGIAFDRVENGRSVVFVARYQDIGNDIVHDVTNIIDLGTSGQFADKPWIGVDIPRPGYPNGIAYLVYSIFLGELEQNVHSKTFVARSIDGGQTWEKPIKLSESQQKNQGTTIAIDPNDGTVYVAWRRFTTVNVTDAMLISRSVDFGRTFTKAAEVSPSNTFFFDQRTYDPDLFTTQFRTYAFPAMAVDNDHRVYMAWSERVDGPEGEARIVVRASTDGGNTFPDETTVDDYEETPCYQFMPSLTFAAGKLMMAWYDSRESVRIKKGCTQGTLVTDTDDYTCEWRHTIDVRAAQGHPDNPPLYDLFDPSIQVSRYLFGIYENELIQMQYNPPNYPLFKGGTTPFHGDYLDIAPAPRFIKEGEIWRFNTLTTDPSDCFVSWTDNRDIRPPNPSPDPSVNPWTLYNPPVPELCISGFHTGMRNQNVYVSKITQGIEVGVLESNVLYQDKQVFAININNKTGTLDLIEESITLNLSIHSPQEEIASFLPDELLENLTVTVPEHSSVSRQVFVEYSGTETLMIEIQVSGDGFADSVYLNVVGDAGLVGENKLIIEDLGQIDWGNPPIGSPIPAIENPDIVNPNIVNPVIVNPNIVNPNIVNPNIVNPNIVNPNIVNPNIVNPNIVNPNIVNPNIVNPNIVNPNIVNPNIVNMTLYGADIIDKFWRVKNTGDLASSYTFKTIAGDSLPGGTLVYTQLLAYKVHLTPGASSTEACNLQQEVHHELLLNITPPNLSPDISDYKKIVDPELINGWISNATFSLDPGEEAIVILRVIDTNQLIPGDDDGDLDALTNGDEFDPASYAGNVGAVAVSHSSTDVDEVTAITLMILPDSLPGGTAGTEYIGYDLRAIGGTEPYTWSWESGSLPEGMNFSAGVISGMPKRAGDFPFTVRITDFDETEDTQDFILHIDPPYDLTITMVVTPPGPPPSGDEGISYPGDVKFIASGGVPDYEGPTLYTWSLDNAPAGLELTLSSDENGETMQLTGTPSQAGDFNNVIVRIRDSFIPTPLETSLPSFHLCIRPKPLVISITPQPDNSTVPQSLSDGYLGSLYDVEFEAGFYKQIPLDWTVTGPPPGLRMESVDENNVKIKILGTPEYENNGNYPKDYTVTVTVTDNFDVTCAVGERKITVDFNITINPKEPAWAVEGDYDGEATALAADESGNVYVTGFIIGATTGKDYYTVKYDADGNPDTTWVAMPLNGPGNGDDIPTAIAVDSSGVYVTGSSDGGTTGPDIFTIKYDLLDGHILQEARYDGPSHLGDGGNDLVLDEDGNVYVTGYVHRGKQTKHADYCTLKYGPSLNMIWDVRYDSRRNGNDIATAIAVDSLGNVYITGKSQESLPKGPTTHDYLTMKYDSSGSLQWLERDDGLGFGDDEPTDMALYEEGESGGVYIYVTGTATGENPFEKDYYTVKYDANGTQAWNRSYNNNLVNGDDVATALAVDSSGNVFVTGKSTGSNGYDYATIKYSSDGTLQLNGALRHDGGVGDDEAVGIAVDGSGQFFVAGFITTQDKGAEYFMIKYKSDGSISWIAQYPNDDDLTPQGDEIATAMAMNSTGIYVTGFSKKDSTSRYVTVKYTK